MRDAKANPGAVRRLGGDVRTNLAQLGAAGHRQPSLSEAGLIPSGSLVIWFRITAVR
jgi:hypothetical protein